MKKLLSGFLFQMIIGGIFVINGWALESSAGKELYLKEAMSSLKAADAAWKANDQEFREMREINQVSETEILEFAEFVASLKRQVFEECEAVRVLGGDAGQVDVDCIEIQKDFEAEQDEDLTENVRKATREEQVDQLSDEFEELAAEYDGMIMDQQDKIKKQVRTGQSSGGWSDSSSGAEQMEEGSEETNDLLEAGAGPGLEKESDQFEHGGGEAGDPRDDDIIARQLREAAENETDPYLKEQLWNEYKKYKKSTR